jgi:putative ABC transport system permease protein
MMVKDLGALTRAVRNISRRKMRAFLVVIALGFSMAIMISVPAGIMANQQASQILTENVNTMLTNYQEEINKTTTLIQCSTSPEQGMISGVPTGNFSGFPRFESGQSETFVNETVGDEIHSIDGVKDVVPFLEKSSTETTSETISTPRGDFSISRPLYTITGVCLNSSFIEDYSILPNVTAGQTLHEGDSDVVLMSQNLSDYFGVGVGSKMDLEGESFTVVGTYNSTGQGVTGVRTVYMNLSDAQAISGEIGNVSRFDVYAEDPSYVENIATVIKAAYSDLYVTTYDDRLASLTSLQERSTETLNNAESTLSQTQTVATQEIIIAIVATSLIVLFMMLYTVRERTKEIGTLKAIGFSSWHVMGQFMLEGMLLSLVAGVVGVAIGSIGAPFLSGLLLPSVSTRLFGSRTGGGFGSPQFEGPGANVAAAGVGGGTAVLNPELMLLVIGLAALLGALGSLYPAWRASRTRPAEAMRYE